MVEYSYSILPNSQINRELQREKAKALNMALRVGVWSETIRTVTTSIFTSKVITRLPKGIIVIRRDGVEGNALEAKCRPSTVLVRVGEATLSPLHEFPPSIVTIS